MSHLVDLLRVKHGLQHLRVWEVSTLSWSLQPFLSRLLPCGCIDAPLSGFNLCLVLSLLHLLKKLPCELDKWCFSSDYDYLKIRRRVPWVLFLFRLDLLAHSRPLLSQACNTCSQYKNFFPLKFQHVQNFGYNFFFTPLFCYLPQVSKVIDGPGFNYLPFISPPYQN